MSFAQIRHRLSEGRPLVVDSDTGASFRARGVLLNSPGALGSVLRLVSDANVNLDYAYGGAAEGSATASVVIGVEDPAKAAAAAGV